MSCAYIDFTAIIKLGISAINDKEEYFNVDEAYQIPIIIPLSEVEELLLNYDPNSATSPSAADSRVIARIVLDALKKVVEG